MHAKHKFGEKKTKVKNCIHPMKIQNCRAQKYSLNEMILTMLTRMQTQTRTQTLAQFHSIWFITNLINYTWYIGIVVLMFESPFGEFKFCKWNTTETLSHCNNGITSYTVNTLPLPLNLLSFSLFEFRIKIEDNVCHCQVHLFAVYLLKL